MRFPTRQRDAWLAGACLALLIAVAAIGAPPAAAQEQGVRDNPWECETGFPTGYCHDLGESCNVEKENVAEEAFCARKWCARVDNGEPPDPDLGGRRPRYTEYCGALHSDNLTPQACRDTEASPEATRPPPMVDYCGFLNQACSEPSADLTDEHVNYCLERMSPSDDFEPPPVTDEESSSSSSSEGDLEAMVSGDDPDCDDDSGVSGAARENCDQSGSTFRAGHLFAYGLDVFVNIGASLNDIKKLPGLILQSVVAMVWYVFILVTNGVMSLLQWAFAMDLINMAFHDIRHMLVYIHEEVIGTPWTLAALSIAGLWGIWNGLVRLRTMQTLGALLTTVLMMTASLVIIYSPDRTVWYFAQLANEGSKSVLSAATTASINNPDQAMADSSGTVFDLLIKQPWCGLQFGDVDYCGEEFPGGDYDGTVEENYLIEDDGRSKSAGSPAREDLYDALREENDTEAEDEYAGRVRLMNEHGAIDRAGLLGLIAATLVGAIILLLWLALKLLLAAIMVLLLTLATPAVLLAPAFGEGGRSLFIKWAKRLAGMIAAKLIYALFLALVLLIAAVIASMDDLGWYPKWLILLVFWWGIFFKRGELLGFLEGDGGGRGSGFPRLASIYYGTRMARDVAKGVSYPGRKVAQRRRQSRLARREGAEEAIRQRSDDQVRGQAQADIAAERGGERDQAQGMVTNENNRRQNLRETEQELSRAERELHEAERDLARLQEKLASLTAMQNMNPTGQRLAEINQLNAQLPNAMQRVADVGNQAHQLQQQVGNLEAMAPKPAELRAAEATVSRYGTGEIQVSEREIDDRLAARGRQLRGQDPRHDGPGEARDRTLLRRANRDHTMSAQDRWQGDAGTDRDLRDAHHTAERDIEADRQRRRVFRR